jgi:hypothetical protein
MVIIIVTFLSTKTISIELVSVGLRNAGTFHKRRILTSIQTSSLPGSLSAISLNLLPALHFSLKTIFNMRSFEYWRCEDKEIEPQFIDAQLFLLIQNWSQFALGGKIVYTSTRRCYLGKPYFNSYKCDYIHWTYWTLI